jgi:UDP-glucose:glycoprotein glucosyltransferase
LLEKSGAKACETWLEFAGKQFCSPQLEKEDAIIQGLAQEGSPLLPFDRQSGSAKALPATIYADITSPEFGKFHPLMKKAAEDGKISYRVRHKPSIAEGSPLTMSGFGAELALKRTDYIVIDDRNAGEKKDAKKDAEDVDEDEEVADLTPLSSSDLQDLSMKAASYILNSEYPLKRLLKVTQDFPKYSSFLASQEISEPLKMEHVGNRELYLPAGYSVMWINGVQYDPRKVDAYSLLDHMRRERKLISSFRELGFSNSEAIQLLTHPALAEVQQGSEGMRYDWRDATEGGNIIIWLNDIEKDKRYEEWPSELMSYLGRTYPGQMPAVKRDLHNLILPVDFSEPLSVTPIVETVQDFVKRKIPVRFGLVPLSHTEGATQQAKVAYHIYEAYGITALLNYLESGLAAKSLVAPHEVSFSSAIEKRKLKTGFESQSLQQVLAPQEDTPSRLEGAQKYLTRLGAASASPPLFINGIPIKNDDEWLQTFSQRVSVDMRSIQKQIWDGSLVEEGEEQIWLPGLFLKDASARRNALVIPEDEGEIEVLSLVKIFEMKHVTESLKDIPTVAASEDTAKEFRSQLMVVIGELDKSASLTLILNALHFRQQQTNVQLLLLTSMGGDDFRDHRISKLLRHIVETTNWDDHAIASLIERVEDDIKRADNIVTQSDFGILHEATPLLIGLGFKDGESGVVFNGRKVGPIPAGQTFTKDDFETLYGYEVKRRVLPATTAISDLGFADKIKSTLDNAKMFSILALSTKSDMPEGIFELPPPVRTRMLYEWNTTHTAFSIGDNSTAAIQIIAAIDPASETAQQWAPILKVLSELDGVFLRVFVNPTSQLQQLPVKRFYRYALETKPSFDEHGAAVSAGVKFEGIPKDALLTAALNVPPSWLVAPKDSVHDLDNIKLSSLPAGTKLEATYELENILIEGHSRDVTTGIAPRGAQLALSTAKDPRFADTLIMANLGYFQFKANPGYYNISLLPGLSQNIFNIDSIGALGYEAQVGDDTTEVTLMSFSGVTLYPRLSRKPGMEDEDVLETPKTAADTASNLASKGAGVVDSLLAKVGVKKPQTGKDVQQALDGARSWLQKHLANLPLDSIPALAPATQRHADINIFSVASGHLYERMLNIMMLSVMKHTKSTVKFWFIEQFLSSSFKAFLPTLAAEYGFQYEYVTYKWPHWLRAQKEKQREIWGYKILFLDVLFPLDLDKVIFVDADQIVRTDMLELVNVDLKGAPYGFTPMCDSRTEMEGFRFWKQGYWKNFLRGLPYHISALYVVDLKRFRQIAAGDRLRQQYHQLSADPGSLSNLDQDLPNNMQMSIPIHTLPQEWLWCETWCSDESLGVAKTIDLCNNPQTKEPKLDRARRQVPEWTEYDDEIAALAKRTGEADVLRGGEQERGQTEEKVKEEEEKAKVPEHGEL